MNNFKQYIIYNYIFRKYNNYNKKIYNYVHIIKNLI